MRVRFDFGENQSIEIYLYAAPHVLKGYCPKVGDCIRGILWLQGHPLEEVNVAESWTDSVASDSELRRRERLIDSIEALEAFEGEHIGIGAFASAVAGAGFDLRRYAKPDDGSEAPFGFIELGERVIDTWLVSYIVGEECIEEFSPARIAQLRQLSIDRGHDAVFVTIVCKAMGEGYEIEAQGLESLQALLGEELRMSLWVRKPRSGAEAGT